AKGLAVAIPPFVVAHVSGPMSPGQVWRHELRWARNILTLDPLGHVLSAVAHPLPWALVAIAPAAISVSFGASPAILVGALGLALAAAVARLAMLYHIARAFEFRPQSYWLVPVHDLLSFAVFVASFFGRNVDWKGHRLRAGGGGLKSH